MHRTECRACRAPVIRARTICGTALFDPEPVEAGRFRWWRVEQRMVYRPKDPGDGYRPHIATCVNGAAERAGKDTFSLIR